MEQKTNQTKSLRLWPGIVAVILQWLLRYLYPLIVNDANAIMVGIFGGIFFGFVFVIWWAFFSRAAIFERWYAFAIMLVFLVISSRFLHESIATTMQGMMFTFYSIPVMSLAFVLWAILSRKLTIRRCRIISMTGTVLLASVFWIFLRTDGMTGDARLDFAWRWSKTAEEKFLAQTKKDLSSTSVMFDSTLNEAEWPGFRGPNRDGIIYGTKINTDWTNSPPKELWRKPVGPGASSFSVHGDYFFTQEQRGDFEAVTCYNLSSGDLVWIHKDTVRFWDSHTGAGPRSTPTIKNGIVYTMGATGILNVLNENDGSLVWSRNTILDIAVKHSGWGYTSSPLVIDSTVFVAIVGSMAAYDSKTGNPLWYNVDSSDSYSSPHLATIDNVEQILLMNGAGVTSFLPANGTILWKYDKPGGSRIVQPAKIGNNDFLIGDGNGKGIYKISVSKEKDGWKVKELWKSVRMRPNHNDLVVHKGNAYGFDGASLVSIDLKEGNRNWKYGRFDGQILLLADQDLLLVTSVKGELSLIKASPEKYIELAKIQAIEGKTWNHPVMVDDVLLVRNVQEMAAFKL